ncbi:MAG: rhodanese-like domain-containing protein [Boseongicola sp.]|nr:rhodanese-like domain-containing protein [Boseongicola sp.]
METEKTEHGTVENWTPQEVKDALDRHEIVLIDVRTPQEYAFERIAGALLSPMQAFEACNMPGQTEKRIVFHCGSGARSGKVAKEYLKDGTDLIAHMKGGFDAWKEAGLSYTGTNMATGAPEEKKLS